MSPCSFQSVSNDSSPQPDSQATILCFPTITHTCLQCGRHSTPHPDHCIYCEIQTTKTLEIITAPHFSIYALTTIPTLIFHLHDPKTTLRFDRYRLDSGAPRTLVGTTQFAAYKSYIKFNITINPICISISMHQNSS